MNPYHCTHCGRFSRPAPKPEPSGDLLKAMLGIKPPSERHQRAEATKRHKRQQATREHLAAWLQAGVPSPKAERVVGHNG